MTWAGAVPPDPRARFRTLSRGLGVAGGTGARLTGVRRRARSLRGTLWHSYRRKWATERKHMPDVDVAQAGGWKSTVSLKTSYQQADTETTLRVVLGAGELREAR